MKGLNLIKGTAVALACLGTTIPQCRLWAASPSGGNVPPAERSEAIQASDVALGTGGTLQGQVLDAQGAAVEGAVVSVRQGENEVARAVTDQTGTFRVANLQGGLYQVAAGNSQAAYRLWAPNTAPPAARPDVVMVSSPEKVMLGQNGILGVDVVTLGLLGLAGTGLGFGIASYNQARSANHQAQTNTQLLHQLKPPKPASP